MRAGACCTGVCLLSDLQLTPGAAPPRTCFVRRVQDLPCFQSQVADTFTTTNASFYKDRVIPLELATMQVLLWECAGPC